MSKELEKKILNKKARIGIIGLGYVGLPLAITFFKSGFQVYGIDIDEDRVRRLRKSESYILDVTPSDIKEAMASGRLTASTDFSLIKKLDAVIICVPTPLAKTKEPDVSYIAAAVEKIKRYMKPGQLVVLESTTYPGTTEEIMLPVLESGGLKEGVDFYLAFSPERVDPGNAKYDTKNTPKIIGGLSKRSTAAAKLLYEQAIDTVVPVSSAKVAEMVKLLENTFRIVNIGLVNEVMLLCDKLGINVWEVIDAARTKPYGFMPFYPGPGVGGHCLSKDEYVFVKDVGKDELGTVRISDLVKELKSDSGSKIHNLNGISFIKPAAKEVFSYDAANSKPSFKKIEILSERPYNGTMINVKTADNRTMSVTSRHPVILNKDGVLGIKFADELKIGDEIPFFERIPTPNDVDNPDCELLKIKIKDISHSRSEHQKVYSMEVADTNTFVTSYGILTHNCIPVDPIYLSWKARMHGFEARFIELASYINSEMPGYVVAKAAEALNDAGKPLRRSKILVMGVAYKKDVKDLRESPALEIIELLAKKGGRVSYYDPLFPYLKIHKINLKCAKLDKIALEESDCVIIVTDHSNVDYQFVARHAPLIVDTRNILNDIKNRSNIVRL